MNTTLNKILDFFIHPSLKIDKSIYEKSRVYIITLLVVYVITLIYVLFYLSISKGVYLNFKSILNYIDIVTTTGALIFVRRTGRISTTFSFLAITYWFLFVASIYTSGGIHSYDIFWLIVLSVASFMFVSIATGFTIAILSILSVTTFYLLESIGLVHFVTTPASLTLSYKFFNFSFILCLLVSMVYVLTRGNKKMQAVLKQNKEQMVRAEIARDFHDQIGNKLASLRHLAELTQMSKVGKDQDLILSKIEANAKDVHDNFRDFIWTLDAKSDQLTELFMYLRDFADDCFKFSDVNLYIESSPQVLPNVVLPSYLSKELVPLFKEAITNVHKHSNAKNVYLTFMFLRNTLTIQLEDDGKGIDQSIIKKGNGLTNMNYRAEKTGGKLDISSVLNSGTTIVYTVDIVSKTTGVLI